MTLADMAIAFTAQCRTCGWWIVGGTCGDTPTVVSWLHVDESDNALGGRHAADPQAGTIAA